MTIKKESGKLTYIISEVTLGKLYAIKNALNLQESVQGLTAVGADILIAIDKVINEAGK